MTKACFNILAINKVFEQSTCWPVFNNFNISLMMSQWSKIWLYTLHSVLIHSYTKQTESTWLVGVW